MPALRERVTFQRLNLMDEHDGSLPGFHIIFCRNVLIYFDRPTQERVIRRHKNLSALRKPLRDMAAPLQIHPYLFFGGNCREAMQFYKSIFGGELMLSTFGEAPADAHASASANAEAMKDKIMHASLNGPVTILASDNPELTQPRYDGQFALSVEGTDEAALTGYFHKLSDGGRILAKLGKQFWGDTFGMVEDQYGVTWMISIKVPA